MKMNTYMSVCIDTDIVLTMVDCYYPPVICASQYSYLYVPFPFNLDWPVTCTEATECSRSDLYLSQP